MQKKRQIQIIRLNRVNIRYFINRSHATTYAKRSGQRCLKSTVVYTNFFWRQSSGFLVLICRASNIWRWKGLLSRSTMVNVAVEKLLPQFWFLSKCSAIADCVDIEDGGDGDFQNLVTLQKLLTCSTGKTSCPELNTNQVQIYFPSFYSNFIAFANRQKAKNKTRRVRNKN